MTALPFGCDKKSFTLRRLVQQFKLCLDIQFLQFAFVAAFLLYIYHCITIQFVFYLTVLSIKLECVATHNSGLFHVYEVNPIEEQNEDKDICRTPVYAELFKLKLMLGFVFCTHESKLQNLGFTTIELWLK